MDLTGLKTLLGVASDRSCDVTRSILAYWEVLEYFQELSFPKLSRAGLPEEEVRVRYVKSEEELDYFVEAPFREADSFRLYAGGIPKYELLSELYRRIPAEKDNERFRRLLEKNKAVSVLYTIDLSRSGEYVEDSFQLSPYIWAISCLIHDHEVDEEWLEELTEEGNEFFMTSDEEEEDAGYYLLLQQLTETLLDKLQIRDLFGVSDSFRRNNMERVCIRALQADDTDLSMSFYAKDLSRVRRSLQKNERHPLLIDYITAPLRSPGNRESICSPENYRKWLSPQRYPMGRWPSEFSPALMQQMAINIALADKDAGGCGIFSVNGPPGTGKTTLLKDIIAEYIVRRARLLADLNKPDDAFTALPILEKTFDQNNQKTFGLRTDRGLADYGILVASCNNTAVENITFELPEMDKLPAKEAMEKAGHSLLFSEENDLFFGDLASNMLNGTTDTDEQTKQAWGLISARLGKGNNIRSFCDMVLRQFVAKMSPKRENEQVMREFKNRFPSYEVAKQNFLSQYRFVERLRRSVRCNEEVFRMEDEKMQSSNPLTNAEFDKAREELFYQALVLHGSFVINSYKWRCNLYSLLAFWDHKYTPDEKERIFLHILNSLFFLVPVVSTTFASVQKMLEYIGKEQLGLLIVDEAGQAAPQCAVGALWRAKKAIIVGDPKQVEPVVTTDETLMSLYQKKCGIASLASYLSKSHSVQGFADQINEYGSWIGETWVGCPLVVHRRCINPMFSISNRVSYDETMILGQKDAVKEEERSKLLFDHSLWIDVPGKKGGATKSHDHYVPEQGDVCLRLILAWMAKHASKEDTAKLYVISPFTTVVKGIKDAVKTALNTSEYGGLKGKFKNWTVSNCGTVHKFQGKEAEEVIFLLGCQPSSTGAIGWVNSNILNVAVTRAKKRVYFIGDYEVWSQQNRNFSTEIIRFSDEDTGLQRKHFSDLPPLEPKDLLQEDMPDLPDPENEYSMEDDILEEDDIDPIEPEPAIPGQEVRPIPKYSFLSGPEYHRRYRVIYSHPYQLIFEVMMTDPADTLPDLPDSFYRKLSDSPSLWMCLIYPAALDFPEAALEKEFDQVIDWYYSL